MRISTSNYTDFINITKNQSTNAFYFDNPSVEFVAYAIYPSGPVIQAGLSAKPITFSSDFPNAFALTVKPTFI
jgi:hypothetical protein